MDSRHLLVLHCLLAICSDGAAPAVGMPFEECLAAAETQISRAPDKKDMFVTTSHLYKRHLAEYFCALPSTGTTALELGIYHGHTTAVLAAIFQKVISVDIEESYLRAAANHTSDQDNVVFIAADLMVDSWRVLRSNRVDVVIIDANHKYEFVRADAHNALEYLSPLHYIVFDDYGHEVGVQRTVAELESAGAIHNCQGIGQGRDGSYWQFQNWDEETGESFKSWTNFSEGIICRRGDGARAGAATDFTDKRFYVYKQPMVKLHNAGIFRFMKDGELVTSNWGNGRWEAAPPLGDSPAARKRDALLLELPGMARGLIELLFNWPRTAFVLSEVGGSQAQWFAIRDNLIHQPFEVASQQFD